MSRRASSTLVVFSLGARIDARRHPLLTASARELEVGLRGACLEGAFAAGRALGMRLVACSPEPLREAPRDALWLPQAEGAFGDRFEAALGESLRQAMEPVVVVGGDVPGLDEILLRAALEGLARDPEAVVVGPARDGGFYLLATARPLGPVLSEVRWCGRDTRKTLLDALARAGRTVFLLPPLRDLDRPADVLGWLAERRPPPGPVLLWSDRLRLFLSACCRPLNPRDTPDVASGALALVCGRSPPPLASS